MRILFSLLLLPLISLSQSTIEVGYKLKITSSLGLTKQIIIAFDNTASEAFNVLSDPKILGKTNPFMGIFLQRDDTYYSTLMYDKLNRDRSIDLYTSAHPDLPEINYTIEVVDTIGSENTIVSLSDSLFPDQLFSFPYNCVGPITGTRFRFHTSSPVKISVLKGCTKDIGGSVQINNPNNRWAEELYFNGALLLYDLSDSVITNLQSGSYEYKWYNPTGALSHFFEVIKVD